MCLPGCSLVTELIAPTANFAMGLYNADTYYSKECAWYELIEFSEEMKAWLSANTPPPAGIQDLAKVARNNDLYKEVCED